MDITGKIIWISEAREGVSKTTGNPWKSQDYVIEWVEGQYTRHCVFTVFGIERIAQMNLQLNQDYTISFDIDAHEYNGRWFNDLRAWRAVPPQNIPGSIVANPAAAQPAAPVAENIPAPNEVHITNDEQDEMPF